MGSLVGLTSSATRIKTAWAWEEADLHSLHGGQADVAFGVVRPSAAMT